MFKQVAMINYSETAIFEESGKAKRAPWQSAPIMPRSQMLLLRRPCQSHDVAATQTLPFNYITEVDPNSLKRPHDKQDLVFNYFLYCIC